MKIVLQGIVTVGATAVRLSADADVLNTKVKSIVFVSDDNAAANPNSDTARICLGNSDVTDADAPFLRKGGVFELPIVVDNKLQHKIGDFYAIATAVGQKLTWWALD